MTKLGHALGVQYAIIKLRRANSLAELQRQWLELGLDMQRDDDVVAVKDNLKQVLK